MDLSRLQCKLLSCPELSQQKEARILFPWRRKEALALYRQHKNWPSFCNDTLQLVCDTLLSNSCYRSCAHGQKLLCLKLRADEAYGSIQWKMTLYPRLCVKTADNSYKSYFVEFLCLFPQGKTLKAWSLSSSNCHWVAIQSLLKHVRCTWWIFHKTSLAA